MIIIGLNSGFEEDGWRCKGGSVSLIIDGKLIMSVAEDRISRHKYDGGYEKALRFILDYNKLSMGDIDYFCISFYGNHLIPNDLIFKYHLKDLELEDCPEKLILVPSHHLSHAISSYFLSPFDEALIMVADNEGSILYSDNCNNEGAVAAYCERNSYYYAKRNCVVLLERDFENPNMVGFGKAYNKFTEYIGLGDYHNGGKTMGLSSYGQIPKGLENVDLWQLDEEGHLKSNLIETYDCYKDINAFLDKHNVVYSDKHDYTTEEGKNLAFYIQNQLNKWTCKKIENLIQRTGVHNICISGGVAQNGVMNATIEKELKCNVFVPPFPSDQGQSLGNAIYAWITVNGLNNNGMITKVKFKDFKYLGSEYTDEEIFEAIKLANAEKRYYVTKCEDISKEVASLLAEEQIVGWFQGKSEYGCRALGARSILASPRTTTLRDKINVLKRRELFRPLAPTVLKDSVDEYFEATDSMLSEYMLGVVSVREDFRTQIAGVTHVDGTARIQVILPEHNLRYYKVVEEYRKLTNIPMITNTSFNMAGEPIVETPLDAINSFRDMGLDALACGSYLIKKKKETL